MWVPCGGAKDANPPTPKAHLGEVRRDNGSGIFELSDEWLTEQQAVALYHGIILSTSHTVCPDCSKAKHNAVSRMKQ